MNKKRRQQIQEVIAKLEACDDELTSIKDDEDDARDNMPENLQESEAYCLSEGYSDKIDDAISYIKEATDALEEI